MSKMDKLSKIDIMEQEIVKMAEEYGDKKWSRCKRTFFVISGVLYLFEIYLLIKGSISDISFDIICALIFSPLVAAGFIMLISCGIMFYITNGAMEDEKHLAKKMGELNAIKFIEHSACEKEKAKTEERENYLEELRIMLAPVVKVNERLEVEDLKRLLKPIVDEYHLIKVKEKLDNDEKNN